MLLAIQEAINSLKEDYFTKKIVIPFINRIHPGRIEYTHSNLESGRDIVSFGKDSLDRDHILAIQVKTERISYGAPALGKMIETLRIAKNQGVTRENGYRIFPHEVWLISSKPFPEQNRRQLDDTLTILEREGIKIIGGEEFSTTLYNKLPDLALKIAQQQSPQLFSIISQLEQNPESRAFGLLTEKTLDEIYITSTMTPKTIRGLKAIAGRIIINNPKINIKKPIINLLDKKYILQPIANGYKINSSSGSIKKLLCDSALKIYKSKAISKKYDLEFIPKIQTDEKELKKLFLTDTKVEISILVKLEPVFHLLIEQAKSKIKTCPNIIDEDPNEIIETSVCLNNIDDFLKNSEKDFLAEINELEMVQKKPIQQLRLEVKDPKNILKLNKIVVIDGPPGCGKTTFMKKLAITLLNNKLPTLFVPCQRIRNDDKNKSLCSMMSELAISNIDNGKKNVKPILLLDGLDESPINLLERINDIENDFSSIVASTRTAYLSDCQSNHFCISIVPFTALERDSFIQNWLKHMPDAIDAANEIIKTHTDVDYHTRLPLVGTIFVALLEGGFNPRTRAEIYDKRLELLLSRWDKAKKVSRILIDNPLAKKRLISELAYRVHAKKSKNQIFSKNDFLDAYENSLGKIGYAYESDLFLNDLVAAHGIIIQIEKNEYSFGHLTFQEHLAGEYLYSKSDLDEVIWRMGDYWWREPLNFYASKKQAIDDLIQKLQEKISFGAHAKQLNEMIRYATFTSPGARDCIEDLL